MNVVYSMILGVLIESMYGTIQLAYMGEVAVLGYFIDGLSLKIKKLHIQLYFIATQYLWNYALVEDIDNWTPSYMLIIIY